MTDFVPNDILTAEMEKHLREGKMVVFTPTGCSMRPFIEGGKDNVTLTQKSHVRVGDIVLARIGSSCVLHRVVHIEDDGLITLMGDGNLRGEEQCRQEDVIGVVTQILSPRGWRKPLSKGWLWRILLPVRKWLLKIYRHTIVKLY